VKRSPTSRDILPLARTSGSPEEIPTGEAFRTQWIDFQNGIRVGNLQPHQRITRILKYRLEEKYATGFVTDRWGRGVYWQWICWLHRANRDAKTVSHGVNFGCAKLFISADRNSKVFQCGLQIERGYAKGHENEAWGLKKDWDWNRLITQCREGSSLEAEIRRLVKREGFIARLEGGGREAVFGADLHSAAGIREAARRMPADQWAGFQVFYPMPEAEVRAASGYELVQAALGAFAEVVPLMNMCVQVGLGPGAAVVRIGGR
jgi:hypothetical protein